jgi:hypothetical protein
MATIKKTYKGNFPKQLKNFETPSITKPLPLSFFRAHKAICGLEKEKRENKNKGDKNRGGKARSKNLLASQPATHSVGWGGE